MVYKIPTLLYEIINEFDRSQIYRSERTDEDTICTLIRDPDNPEIVTFTIIHISDPDMNVGYKFRNQELIEIADPMYICIDDIET
jgi:hypothetical protein